MKAVVTTGNGGYDKLVYRDVPFPVPGPGEVLVRVLAAGVNNTEINTRLGWYSSSVTSSTQRPKPKTAVLETVKRSDGGWNAATPLPFIQGTDCCGRIGFGRTRLGMTALLGRRIFDPPLHAPPGFLQHGKCLDGVGLRWRFRTVCEGTGQ